MTKLNQTIKTTFLNLISSFGTRLANIWKKIWSNKLYPVFLLLFIFGTLLAFILSYCGFRSGFFHINSDDILQYYVYVSGFFDKIKNGNLSLYDTNIALGASFFNGSYYIPLDIFTGFAFLLSLVIPNEYAYCISFYLRVLAGALVFYYVLVRHINVKAAFFGAVILFVGGMTEAYYIFPVYLGIIFYAPLAMLVVDLVIEKGKAWYLVVPVYTFMAVMYDFYIAYMLMAFICIYFIIKCTLDIELMFLKKKFWLSFLKFMVAIFVGLLMGMAIMLPSALYIMNESSRSSSGIGESLWYFSKTYMNENGTFDVSWKHYFTQIINLFIPNEPHRFCLVDAGDYVREHASLYITSGGLVFFTYFFFSNNRKDNILKIWVILFNIALCIPAFSIVLGLNSCPYVRWFFIPYMLNAYAMAIGIDRYDSGLKERNFIKLFAMILLSIGIVAISYVLATNTDLFFHYKPNEVIYYPLLIISLVFCSLYFAVLLLSFVLKLINKHPKFLDYIIPGIIVCECIFAGFMIFGENVDNTSDYYFRTKNEMVAQKNYLKNNLGYKESDGYRINLYTTAGREVTNANVLVGNVNFGKFFQSFYNTPLNTILSDVYGEDSTSWSRNFSYGYNLISGPVFNVKYIVTNEGVELSPEFYSKTVDENNVKYFKMNADTPFIVYDSALTEYTYLSGKLGKEASLLHYAYIKLPDGTKDGNADPYIKKLFDSYETVFTKYNITKKTSNEVSQEFRKYDIKCATTSSYSVEYGEYRVYDMTTQSMKNVMNNDIYFIWPNDIAIRRLNDGYMYLRIKNKDNPADVDDADHYGALNQLHYNTLTRDVIGYDNSITQLLVKRENDNNSGYTEVYSSNKRLYTDFVEKQATYTDKYMSLDGSKLTIKFTNPTTNKAQIIKTGYAYSDDWKVETEGYEKIIVDGSFLGIIVPEGVSNVNLTVKYSPKGFNLGVAASAVGFVIYLGVTIPICVYIIKKRKRGYSNEKNSNNSSLL